LSTVVSDVWLTYISASYGTLSLHLKPIVWQSVSISTFDKTRKF